MASLYFNTARSVFRFDPSLQNIIWRSGGNGIIFTHGEHVIPAAYGTSLNPEINVDEVKFGDSYEQVTEAGINPVRDVFEVLFSKQRREVTHAVQRFLKGEGNGSIYNRRPSEWFWWLPPYPFYANSINEPMRIRCLNYSIVPIAFNAWDIKCTFAQTFEP